MTYGLCRSTLTCLALELFAGHSSPPAYINGHSSLSGWQWAYLIIGLIGFIDAILVYLLLPDFPDSPPSRRQFLTRDQGAFLVARLPPSSSRSTDADFDWRAIRRELRTPQLCTSQSMTSFCLTRVGTVTDKQGALRRSNCAPTRPSTAWHSGCRRSSHPLD